MARRALRILISAGPTREPLDPVRYLSNASTGVMGRELAAAALQRGHRVTMVCGPGVVAMPPRATVVPVTEAREMGAALRRLAPHHDAILMAAAVADFRPAHRAASKLTRGRARMLRLVPVPDLIGTLPRHAGQVRIGFALETGPVVPRAGRKMTEKHLDAVLAQRIGRSGPFGAVPVEAWLLEAGAAGRRIRVRRMGRVTKSRIAGALLDKVEQLWYGRQGRF